MEEGALSVLEVDALADDQAAAGVRPGPLVDRWPPVYSDACPPRLASRSPAYVLPRAGRALADDVHREGRRLHRLGESDRIASEDRGEVDSQSSVPCASAR